jgi:hypothetical protein
VACSKVDRGQQLVYERRKQRCGGDAVNFRQGWFESRGGPLRAGVGSSSDVGEGIPE